MEAIKVCIVDDNSQLRSTLQEIISMSEDYRCVGTMATAEQAIREIPGINPDVVLMDINLGTVESGIDCVRVLKPQMPATNFMMCTVYEEDEKIFEALRAGASGYILKKTTPSILLHAIRELYEGGAPMSSQIARKVVAAFSQQNAQRENDQEISKLTNREKEILEWLSKGLTYKEIAANLFLSPETIRKHVYHIYEKLHVTNRVEAVNKFFGR
ncbi:MAG: DNA-binding response regulator [Sphingobacteriales bacterium SCN 48-20]|uniref:response regulator n=1 Tax=Terrimonas ferruginea TaxID=249 RepID=UPI0008693DEC|nr:response regulator transcription factor [Terrimonas ferruginea]MBN8781610.1 response regulator transcription factor [Terrimonas ferruginea]ODT94020.1 MAG: DNA-binding response regulator [Sphingobacteriales bacterium SCN 48-20]OJW44770.1 MAG: DNA-binding response regulator [Sphingobacteriales bacterium 48-107]